jgi:hypothetical protein
MGKQGLDVVNKLGAIGFEFYGPWGVSVSSNLTPKGSKNKFDVAIKKMIMTSVRLDGSPMTPPRAICIMLI